MASTTQQALRILEEERLNSFYEEQKRAAAQAEADARALQAELARLRARSEIDVLRDEVAQMRAEQMAALKACHLARLPLQEIPLHAFGELDLSVKSSKEELATARGEIAELKALVHALIGTVARRAGVEINKCDENGERLKNYIKAHHGGSNVDSIYMG
jgi:multidrug efflux pump subunit AcrA (membrane-fusion protein)